MVARRRAGSAFAARASLLAAIAIAASGCGETGSWLRPAAWETGPDQPIQLPEAEQMIDELGRILTSNGTISVKSPDVWGQDRLAKFRSEYEAQMGAWLKRDFKADINASVRRGEIQSTLIQVATERTSNGTKTPATTPSLTDDAALLHTTDQARAGLDAGPPGAIPAAPMPPAWLEPGVVLDEHSDYLNHLNQLRRVNAGDDLADRPGYGLYLVRIPVTLSPGPRSRRGKGAVISVSARPLITKHTMRTALRNVVVNEAVANLTQAICHVSAETHDQPAAPASGPFSLISFGDTELFYGPSGISRLREEIDHQLARDLGDEPHHRTARVAEWLRGELEASYHLLDGATTPSASAPRVAAAADPLEEIGDWIARRDFARIVQIRPRGGRDVQVARASVRPEDDGHESGGRRDEVVGLLAFALRIQAASVNRRLKQDMIDQDPSLGRESLRDLNLFAPEASDEAMAAFERYVNAKWPLRVYAIEPVIAQQNVADSLSRRTQAAVDLIGSAPAGIERAIAGLTSDRRTAEDETAIRLNPTMVGFGAGRSTFGWIFYPRIQTGRRRDGRLLTDLALLLNGRLPDPVGADQSIEPGQRECTAIIELPNFVPKIEFVTVASWFRNSETGDGLRSDLEKGTVLGRKLVAAEAALDRARVEGQYRPEEYQIAKERLEQLRDMMPTQRLIVRVPSSGDNNDARVFCSMGLQLRPSLAGWHGRPPEQGVESTIFLEGKYFSVHDTHVIAGGKPAQSVLVSRQLLKVTIAADAAPTPGVGGRPVLEITVATPNGVSNHLLIKMASPDPSRPHASPPPPPEPVKAEPRKAFLAEGEPKPERPKHGTQPPASPGG